MKLYLSSYFFGNNPQRLVRMIKPGMKVAIIMNAADIYGNEKRPTYLANEVRKFKSLGFEAEELDLRDYFKSPESLIDRLHEYGAVWVMGGNSFVLRRAMLYSGFDKLIVPLIEKDSIVYAGFSAGSVVAAKTLRGIELVDDPKAVPEQYDKEVVWDGLDLVNYSIAPHYHSDHPESEAIEKVVQFFETEDMPYKTLHDGEVIVIDGTEECLLS